MRAVTVAVALAAGACGGTAAAPAVTDRPDAPFAPLDYDDAASWVCDPTRDDDPCTTADLTATEVLPDGSTREVAHARAEDPAIDCFYVHPTFAFAYEGGHETTTDGVERALDPVLHQAAPLTSHCRVFAPRYRQIRLAEYVVARDVEAGLERAYADVEAAFRHYLAHHAEGRPFVLLGHSQGTHTGRRLLERVIARDDALRGRLALAVLLGGDVLVDAETGETTNTGGVPLCRGDVQRGCVLAYRAYAKDHPPPGGSAPTVIGGVPEGQLPACNVPSRDGERIRFAATYLATRARQNAYDPWPRNRPPFDTPFVLYRDFYEGECVRDGAGYPYLAVSAPGAGAEARDGDVRVNRIPFDAIYYRPDVLGAHLIEFGLVVGDLRGLLPSPGASATEEPSTSAGEDDDRSPLAEADFPAVSADGAAVATRTLESDCCSSRSRLTVAIRSLAGATLGEWVLSDTDEEGEERVAPAARRARLATAERRLADGGFRPMARIAEDEEGIRGRVALGDGRTLRLDGTALTVERAGAPRREVALPDYERDSDCCDGGLGRGGTCRIAPSLVGVWRSEDVVVVAAAAPHSRDGCGASATYHVVAAP